MYPEDLIAPMRAELTQAGFDELRDADAMKTAIQSEGTTLVVINNTKAITAKNKATAGRDSFFK